MPDDKQHKASTTVSSPAQGRFTMQLPVEVGKDLDIIGERMSEAVFQQAGIRVELSRPDVVKSLVATAKAVQAEQRAEQAKAGAEG